MLNLYIHIGLVAFILINEVFKRKVYYIFLIMVQSIQVTDQLLINQAVNELINSFVTDRFLVRAIGRAELICTLRKKGNCYNGSEFIEFITQITRCDHVE